MMVMMTMTVCVLWSIGECAAKDARESLEWDFYVSNFGDDSGKGTKTDPFETIAHALATAQQVSSFGGVQISSVNIFLLSGIFTGSGNQNLVISLPKWLKSLTISGAQVGTPEKPVIKCSGTNEIGLTLMSSPGLATSRIFSLESVHFLCPINFVTKFNGTVSDPLTSISMINSVFESYGTTNQWNIDIGNSGPVVLDNCLMQAYRGYAIAGTGSVLVRETTFQVSNLFLTGTYSTSVAIVNSNWNSGGAYTPCLSLSGIKGKLEIDIFNSSFYNCNYQSILVPNSSSISIVGSTFTIPNVLASSQTYPAISAGFGSKLVVTQSTFSSLVYPGTAPQSQIQAAIASSGLSVQISHCKFFRLPQAAIYLSGMPSLSATIQDSSFTESSQSALIVDSGVRLVLTDTAFSALGAPSTGGSILAKNFAPATQPTQSKIFITNCTFDHCSAIYGSAICNYQAIVNIQASSFSNCKDSALGGGGTIADMGTIEDSSTSITSSSFTNSDSNFYCHTPGTIQNFGNTFVPPSDGIKSVGC